MQAYLTHGKVETILDTDNRELRDALGLVLCQAAQNNLESSNQLHILRILDLPNESWSLAGKSLGPCALFEGLQTRLSHLG